MRLHTRTVAALAALLLGLSCDSVSSPTIVSTPTPATRAAPTRQPPSPAAASVIEVRVVGVSDGDTVTVLDAGRRQHKIRLLGVDAPEKDQDFGERSKQNLSDLVFGKDVTVEYEKKNRYGRTLGKRSSGIAVLTLSRWRRGSPGSTDTTRTMSRGGPGGARRG